jgi:hypothetical protein
LDPLAVEAGLNDPQLPAGLQLQFTPALAVSFVTVADTVAVPPTERDEGGIVEIATATAGGGCWDTAPPHPQNNTAVVKKPKASFWAIASLQRIAPFGSDQENPERIQQREWVCREDVPIG